MMNTHIELLMQRYPVLSVCRADIEKRMCVAKKTAFKNNYDRIFRVKAIFYEKLASVDNLAGYYHM